MTASFRLAIALCICFVQSAPAQDSITTFDKVLNFPDKLFSSINKKSADLQSKLTRQTEKYLNRLARQEKKLYKQLKKKDSISAKELFGDVDARYAELKNKLTEPTSNNKLRNVYSGHIDSLCTALNFLDQNKLLSQSAEMQQKLKGVMQNYNGLQGKLNQTDQINKYLQDRQQLLKQQIEKFGLVKQFRKFQTDVHYYKEQVSQYKKDLEYPTKWEARLLQLANKIPAFKNFFNKYSDLASIFRLSGNDEGAASIAGLQTRSMLMQDLQGRLGTGTNIQQAVQQNINSAQGQLNQLKSKVGNLANGSNDVDMPNFRSNSQRKKSFFQRIEYSTDIQSAKSNNFLPANTSFAFSAGYMINDQSIAGIGLTQKIGWGSNIRNIRITYEAIGFRSFLDIKIRGGFRASGGGELNYHSQFRNFTVLNNFSPWQKSVLIGIKKIYKTGKLKGNVSVLYDFLHQSQPAGQALIFRAGYNFQK